MRRWSQKVQELAVLPVCLVGGDPAGGDARLQCPGEHDGGLSGLGVELHWLGYARRGAAVRVVGPGLRQVQFPVDQRTTQRACVGQEHTQLTVLYPAGGAGVLALDSHGSIALLDESGFVHDEYAVAVTEMLGYIGPEIVTYRVGIPASGVE